MGKGAEMKRKTVTVGAEIIKKVLIASPRVAPSPSGRSSAAPQMAAALGGPVCAAIRAGNRFCRWWQP